MEAIRTRSLVRQMGDLDLALCLLFNRTLDLAWVKPLFAAVSRLGDGVFWYTLMLLLPLTHGRVGLLTAAHMLLVGSIGVALYKLLKHRFLRQRPFVTHSVIRLGARPLDEYSFPSGHTLHAVGFATVVAVHIPGLFWLVAPFAVLVALSRMVLGLHYPSDVVMGAGIGGAIAWSSLQLLV